MTSPRDPALTPTSGINVAYDGTSADLGSDIQGFTWDELTSSTESLIPDLNFTAINGAAPGTVSPKDLVMDGSGSVPPSTAFTNLTTPGSAYLDTPDDAYETSPMFDSLDTNDVWPSLFEHYDFAAPAAAPEMTRTVSGSSAIVVHPGGVSRKRSATNASPLTATVRPSSVVGVTKRGEKQLAPIVVDPSDTVAVKRARNTAAARKSRDKKFKEVETYKQRIEELEQEVEHWKAAALARGSN